MFKTFFSNLRNVLLFKNIQKLVLMFILFVYLFLKIECLNRLEISK